MKYGVLVGNLWEVNVGFSVGDWSLDKTPTTNVVLSTRIFY